MTWDEVIRKIKTLLAGEPVHILSVQETSSTPYVRLEYGGRERTVKCAKCERIIPKDVPRFYWYAHFWFKGHLCMECGLYNLQTETQTLLSVASTIDRCIKKYKRFSGIARELIRTKEYQERMRVGELIKALDKER